MNSITQATEAVVEYTEQFEPDFIHVSELPCYTKQDELNELHHCSIEVKSADRPSSTLRIALNKMFVDGEQSSRLLQRWPGIVVYNDPHPILADLLQLLNEEKNAFKLFVNSIAKKAKNQQDQQGAISYHLQEETKRSMNPSTLRDKKWELVHSTYSMLVTLYVYRNIHVIDGPITAAYFNWLRAPNIKRISKTDLINHLEWHLRQADKALFSKHSPEELSKAISAASSSSRTEYIHKIPQPPRPNLALHFADDRRPKATYASLPTIVLNQGKAPFSFKPLKSFNEDALKDRKERSDAKPLIQFYKNFYYAA